MSHLGGGSGMTSSPQSLVEHVPPWVYSNAVRSGNGKMPAKASRPCSVSNVWARGTSSRSSTWTFSVVTFLAKIEVSDTLTDLRDKGHLLVIKPMPSHPAVLGGLGRDEFGVDHAARTVTCPADHAPVSPERAREFRPALWALPIAMALDHRQGPLVQCRALRCRARRGSSRLARPGADSDLSPAQADGKALDLLACRQQQQAPALSRSRAQRGLAKGPRRGFEPSALARARAQLRRDLGADDIAGPRERPKEGTTPAVKRPTSATGSHPLPRLFGAGLSPRTHPHVRPEVVQLKGGLSNTVLILPNVAENAAETTRLPP